MTTLVVEDGTSKIDANTYVSVDDARLYNVVREPNRTVWIDKPQEIIEGVLLDARIALDAMFTWRGAVATTTQALPLPRDFVYDDDGRLLDAAAQIELAANAQAQMAYRLLEERAASPNGMAGPAGAMAESIGDWSISYRNVRARDWPELGRMVRGLAASGGASGGFSQSRVVRWS